MIECRICPVRFKDNEVDGCSKCKLCIECHKRYGC